MSDFWIAFNPALALKMCDAIDAARLALANEDDQPKWDAFRAAMDALGEMG
jgi:hypothetical protein